jgi:hypothetical protein
MPEARCIYCPELFDPNAGEGDYVLPRAFGDFDSAITFRGVCTACNNKLSPLEEELLRTAPEAVFRRFAGAALNRRGKPVGWQAASGVPSPRFVIKHEDHDELIKADPNVPGRACPVDQLILVLKDGSNVHISLFPTMSAAALRRKIQQQGVDEAQIERSYLNSDEKNTETFKALIKELWPNLRYGDLPDVPAGVHQVPVRIQCKFTQKYYRAIAKIAFHYLLSVTRCGFTGHEAVFAPMRKFIMEGGDQQPYFDAQKPEIRLPVGVLPDGKAMLPARWMHMLCGFESPSSAVVAVYTLFGPQRPPSPHFVTLFHKPSPIILQQHRYGHAYIYGEPDLGDTREAFVEPFTVDFIG